MRTWRRSTLTGPLYEITVEGNDASICTGEDLIAVWSHTVPDLAAQALDLSVGSTVTVYKCPEVVVRRIS